MRKPRPKLEIEVEDELPESILIKCSSKLPVYIAEKTLTVDIVPAS